MMTIKEFREWFDEQFFILLEEKSATFLEHSNNVGIQKVLKHFVLLARGGKRLRPYMAYVGYVSEGGEEEIFPLYAALEFLHLFCLVHDDIMDNDVVRHNTLTMHRHVESLYGNPDVGNAIAILAGDLLMAWAYECLETMQSIEPYTIDEASMEFRETVAEVIHGQMLDMFFLVEPFQMREMIEKNMELKSARYSFFHPLYIGMLAAGADESMRSFAEEYAVSLGMAFQLQDDIADCIKDVEERKQTLLTWYMQDRASEPDQQAFEEYADTLVWSDEDEQKLMLLLEHSGALSFAEKQLEEYFLKAEDAIFNHDKTGENIWHEIIEEIKK